MGREEEMQLTCVYVNECVMIALYYVALQLCCSLCTTFEAFFGDGLAKATTIRILAKTAQHYVLILITFATISSVPKSNIYYTTFPLVGLLVVEV